MSIKCHRAVIGSTSAQRLLVVGALMPALRNEVSIKVSQDLYEAFATFVAKSLSEVLHNEVSIKSALFVAEDSPRRRMVQRGEHQSATTLRRTLTAELSRFPAWRNEVSIKSARGQSDSSSAGRSARLRPL